MDIEQAKRKNRIEAGVLLQSYTQTHANSATYESAGGRESPHEEGRVGGEFVKMEEGGEEVSLTSEEMRQRTDAARAAVMVLLYPSSSDSSWYSQGGSKSQRRW
jgi:hypothetical protein